MAKRPDARDRMRQRDREYWHCYAARRQGATIVERFPRSDIFTRDGGVCGICGRPVPPSEGTLDHILPISRGGVHAPANVRLAHLDCNAQRGNWNFGDPRMTKYRTNIPRSQEGWSFREREFWTQVAQDLEALWKRSGYEGWNPLRESPCLE